MKKKNPEISVIISTYNRADKLKRAVSSVLSQSFNDFEVIVYDDCSTDKTQKFLKSIKDERLKVIRGDKNFGSDTKPKNEATSEARGRFIAYLDDDNEYLKDHLQVLYSAITNSNADVVYGDRMVIDEEGQVEKQVGIFSNYNPFLLLQRNYIDTSDVLVRREAIFDVGGWDERYRKYVDWNLWVRMAKAGKRFLRVPKIITNYYLHSGMKSARKEDERGFMKPAWEPYNVEIDLPYLHTPHEIKVAVFSLTYNRLEYTKKCFESLKNKAGYPYDHYVVDNGSTDGTVEWLKTQDIVKIYNKENKGISIASNQAIDRIMKGHKADLPNPNESRAESYKYDIIIKYDNDCLSLTQDWLKTVVDLYKRNHMVVMSPYPEGLRDNPGGPPRLTYGNFNGQMIGVVNHIGGLCHIAPASVYEDFRWNEDQPLHGLQDLELSQYISKQGYQQIYLEGIKVEHIFGTAKQHKDYPEYFEKRKLEKVAKPK